MFCPYCGTHCPDGARFCTKCGRSLDAARELAGDADAPVDVVEVMLEKDADRPSSAQATTAADAPVSPPPSRASQPSATPGRRPRQPHAPAASVPAHGNATPASSAATPHSSGAVAHVIAPRQRQSSSWKSCLSPLLLGFAGVLLSKAVGDDVPLIVGIVVGAVVLLVIWVVRRRR